MQYMHFNSSCAFCCVANLLELQGKTITDIELFQNMKADLLLCKEAESGQWQTGAMLQSGNWFDLALRPLGFSLEESYDLSPEAVIKEEPPFMVGLKTEGRRGRHAHVLMERGGGRMIFLNPHREDEREEDIVTLTGEECAERLAPRSVVGRLVPCAQEKTDFQPLLKQAEESWGKYRDELFDFIQRPHTPEELRSALDPLFRALLLDGLEGARICGHEEQAERLQGLQKQLLTQMRSSKICTLAEHFDAEELSTAFAFYQTQIDKVLA